MYHRFLSPDPARDQHFEETQSWNIYSYVRNSPVSSADPTGMLIAALDGVTRTSGGAVGQGGNGVFQGLNYSLSQTQEQSQSGTPGTGTPSTGTTQNEVTQATGGSTGIKELPKGQIDKTDHLLGDPKGLQAAKDLEKLGGYGLKQTERGVWFVFDASGKFAYVVSWPWSAANNKQTIPSLPSVPAGFTVEMGHTHPFLGGRTQHPSDPQDIDACTQRNMNGYVFSRNGVYRIENPSRNVTAVAGSGWWE